MAGQWLRVDERTDVLSSSDLLAVVGPRLQKNPYDWKWMILAAHSGAQGALVCAIQDSTGTNILTRQSAGEMLEWLESLQGERPKEHLADFVMLLKKFRKRYPSALRSDQHRLVLKLHREFRNKFAHFTPTHWSIEISMLPALVGSSIDLIEIAMRQDQVLLKLSGNFKRRLAKNLDADRQSILPQAQR